MSDMGGMAVRRNKSCTIETYGTEKGLYVRSVLRVMATKSCLQLREKCTDAWLPAYCLLPLSCIAVCWNAVREDSDEKLP